MRKKITFYVAWIQSQTTMRTDLLRKHSRTKFYTF